ncbi:MAG: acyl-CoA reductase [Gemmatimonadota bacterium]|nr:MAG: acyl-CoA reductase [Gemmatimonadota bacterium]
MTPFDGWTVPVDAGALLGEERAESAGGAVSYPVLSSDGMRGLCECLRSSREALVSRAVRDIAASLGAVGARFGSAGDPLREEALSLLPRTAGVSPPMAELVLDGMARDWTVPRLLEVLEAEFADPCVLDTFQAGAKGSFRALGPPLTLHIGAGTVPGVSVTSLIRALLVKSAVLVKPGLGDVVLPNLYLRGLQEHDPEIAAAAAALYWPGGGSSTSDGEAAALAEADAVIVYGGDDTICDVRSRTPASARIVVYHHRLSLGLVGVEALVCEVMARETVSSVARAVATFDQRGCVSPHLVYVEQGGVVSPAGLAGLLAEALEALERELPSGSTTPEEASAIHQVRGATELRIAAREDVAMYSGGEAQWTVIYEPEPDFKPSCLNRVVRVAPIRSLMEVVPHLASVRRHLQTVAVLGAGEQQAELHEALARAGVLRITGFDDAPWPPPWWHHDGMGPLTTLVRWIDAEG